MPIETYLYCGQWNVLERFVLYELPPSHDVCFLTKKDLADSKTYILSLDPEIITKLKANFEIVRCEMDPSISPQEWIRRGNKNLLPESLL
ncbi:hypothetical protein ACFP1I_00910 [Dyadobacter subterraneus]|uniref:Uncharacterized protein n=1 Tax=Dyadobacter subterraneus TaxID=2773304 RepID=A0ABR9WMB0_9BACT|nr:hypothetical protein [Dyadobacter subterraneus]